MDWTLDCKLKIRHEIEYGFDGQKGIIYYYEIPTTHGFELASPRASIHYQTFFQVFRF